MRGSIKKRYKDTWSIILDLGYQADIKTGKLKRKQKWFTVNGTKREAEAKLSELLHNKNHGQVIEPSKLTFGEWLDEWLRLAIKPPKKRVRTYETYSSVITNHLKPKLGHYRLRDLRASHLQDCYDQSNLSRTTLQQHQAIIHHALKSAVRQDLIPRNVASLVEGKPRQAEGHEDVLKHCWETTEAQAFLAVAKAAGPQQAVFYTIALETGARKAELCGIKWEDLDFQTGRLSIKRQLVKLGQSPVFGPPKNGQPRSIILGPETLSLLRLHRRHQSELKLANGSKYNDLGLIFAKEWDDVRRGKDTLGDPLQMNNLGQREFSKLIREAGVRPIKFHGLRHTCATLMLKAGVPIHVVKERLGHKRIEITLGIYAHALPSMQKDAARKLSSILHC